MLTEMLKIMMMMMMVKSAMLVVLLLLLLLLLVVCLMWRLCLKMVPWVLRVSLQALLAVSTLQWLALLVFVLLL